jgi:acetoin utilization protein AcuB
MSAITTMVSQLMRQPLVTAGPGASVEEVELLARTKGIHHVPIVQRGKLLGIVCTCDLKGARPNLRALQLARRNVVTAQPDSTAAEVARLMIDNAVGSVVVSNRDGLWGIVTRGDFEHADSALADLLALRQCAACKSARHLRPGPGETLLCAACADRASAAHWYDEGGGD